MSDKPSLYVVEKKEVVILVILFVLVTVLSFTMGVRYGESVGKKAAHEQVVAQQETGTAGAEQIGGKLGEQKAVGAEAPLSEDLPSAPASDSRAAPKPAERPQPPAKESVDKSSDEFLLDALKESGIEPPGGKAPNESKLPDEVKRVRSGYYVIQVGSHLTKSEAESQARQLRAKSVSPEILPPFKDRQGEWHRVVVGSYKTKREAEKEAQRLKGRRVILSFFVWRLP